MSCKDSKDMLYRMCKEKNLPCKKTMTKSELLDLMTIRTPHCNKITFEIDIYNRFCIYTNIGGIETEHIGSLWNEKNRPPIQDWKRLVDGEPVNIYFSGFYIYIDDGSGGLARNISTKKIVFGLGGDNSNSGGEIDYNVAKRALLKMWNSKSFKKLYNMV